MTSDRSSALLHGAERTCRVSLPSWFFFQEGSWYSNSEITLSVFPILQVSFFEGNNIWITLLASWIRFTRLLVLLIWTTSSYSFVSFDFFGRDLYLLFWTWILVCPKINDIFRLQKEIYSSIMSGDQHRNFLRTYSHILLISFHFSSPSSSRFLVAVWNTVGQVIDFSCNIWNLFLFLPPAERSLSWTANCCIGMEASVTPLYSMSVFEICLKFFDVRDW